MKKQRIESDSLGEVAISNDALWGPQTQRSLENFTVGEKKLALPLIYALAAIKKYAARVNTLLGVLSEAKSKAIEQACDEILTKKLDSHFPLKVFQTGSGTQTNMNLNEVIAHRASQIANVPIHPNDDVNKSQSSNDVFPTAMHIALSESCTNHLLPALKSLIEAFLVKEQEFYPIIKIGRTHLMDAVPIRLGQEFSGYRFQLEEAYKSIQHGISLLMPLAIGGTAVGTGLNCPEGFKEEVVRLLSVHFDLPFRPGANLYALLAAHDDCIEFSSKLKRLSCALFKIAQDIRMMGSGPRAGLAELILPENEPGSSIMPGKVNPTQSEMVTMVAVQVMGLDSAVSFAGSQGHFELNVFKPLIASNILEMIDLLTSACINFKKHCIDGLKANEQQIKHHVEQSLLLATGLVPKLGYDTVAKLVLKAHHEGLSLKQVVLSQKLLSEDEFNKLANPENML